MEGSRPPGSSANGETAEKAAEKLAYKEKLKAAADQYLRPARSFLVRRLGEKRAKWLLAVLETLVQYIYDFKWKTYEKTGFSLIRQYWRAGWLGRTGLLALAICTVLAAAALSGSLPSVSVGQSTLTPVIMTISLATLTLGWAFGLAAAVQLPLWGYILVCAYLTWYGMLAGGSVAGSFAFALPTLWMVIIGWRIARTSPARGRWIWLLILGLGAGHLTYAAFGLASLIPDEYNLAGRMLLGLVYFALLNNRLSLGKSTEKRERPSREFVFGGSLVVVGAFLGVATVRDTAATSDNLLLAMRSLLGIVDLFWFWLGWSLFDGGISVAEWVTKKTIHIIKLRAARIAIPCLWVLCTLFGWVTTHPIPFWLATWNKQIGLQDWTFTWTDSTYFAVKGSVYAGIAVIVIASVLALLHKLPQKRLVQLTSLWAASYLGLLGYYESLSAFATLEEAAAAPLSFFAGLSLVGGILWKLAKSGVSYWESRSRTRLLTLTSVLLLMLSISTTTLGASLPDLKMEYTLYSFFGVIYLGIPLTLMGLIPEFTHYKPPAGSKLFSLFAIGCLSAVIVMIVNPYAGPHLVIAPLIWLVTLVVFGKRLTRLDHPLDGVLAGSALGLGFVTFWMAPQALPIPFLVAPNEWQASYLTAPLDRPLLEAGHIWITLAALLCGSAMGAGISYAKQKVVQVAAGLAACAALTVVAPLLPGIPTSAPVMVSSEVVEATATPLPEAVIPTGWKEVPMEGAGLAVALPPDWMPNPNQVEGLLINQFSPDMNALFSSRVYEGYTDRQYISDANVNMWRTLKYEIKFIRGPEERMLGNWNGLWLEAALTGSDTINVYILVPDGVLELNILCTPGQVENWEPLMEQIAASLHTLEE